MPNPRGIDWTCPSYILTPCRVLPKNTQCPLCGRRIFVGELVRFGPRRKRAIHGECTPLSAEEIAEATTSA